MGLSPYICKRIKQKENTLKFQDKKDAVLLLEDGTLFWGKSIGVEGTASGELCFNTGMTGYQEIFTDPSYYGQIMVTTNAHIGNYGVKDDEVESDGMKIAGLVCRNFNFSPSRAGSDGSLQDYFKSQNKLAISDVDTRAVVSYIRDKGAMNAVISTYTEDLDALKKVLAETPNMKGLELASKVSTKEPYFFGDPQAPIKIAALDLGIKRNILRCLAERGCYIKVFPYNTPLEELKKWNPDGYFLSNGPGDPEPLKGVQEVARQIIEENLPLFGICLGHQIIALSQGIGTYKMHNGHRGINHPVMNLETGRGEITSQNHGFVVCREQAEASDRIIITHEHLNDHTVAGIRVKGKKCFSVQYHPEASPGPHDASYLFDQFIAMIKG